jgi:hypothetical protein
MLALFPLHVYESTSQARFIAKVSNQGDLLISPFFLALAGLVNLQRYLQSFAFSSQIHISFGFETIGMWQGVLQLQRPMLSKIKNQLCHIRYLQQ